MIKKEAQNAINDNMMEYSAFVLTQRALPDFRDGMKPVHRRILYSMKANNTTKLTKSATVAGRIMEIHPHGSTYPSIVNLVQKDRQNIPLLEGKGSWGQFTSSRQGAAADRYTEVKLGPASLELMKELKNNSVNYIPNYDGTIMIPEVLPVTYPTILTQANSGIGVGFASDTLSYNLHEIRDVIEEYLKTNEINKVLVPDFPTGAYIIESPNNDKEIEKVIETGRGSITMRAKADIKNNQIIVSELPYGVRREQIIDRIVKLSKDKYLPEVTDVRDGTSFTGMKIVITLRKNANSKEVLQKLYLMTPMQSNVTANMNMLVDGYPVVLGVNDVLERWVTWRKNVIKVGLQNDLNNMEASLHLLRGMKKILLDIDKAINIIKGSMSDAVAIKGLCEEFKIDETQAKHVANIRLINLNADKIKKQLIEIKTLDREWHLLKGNINNADFINKQLMKTMDDSIKIINAPARKTKMMKINKTATKMISAIKKESNKVEDYECYLMMTSKGYVYKSKGNLDQATISLNKKVILGDTAGDIILAKNSDLANVFLKDGKIGRIKVDEIELDNGVFVPAILDEELNEVSLLFIPDDRRFVVLGYSDGQMVKFSSEVYDGINKVLQIGYRKDSNLVFAKSVLKDKNPSITLSQGRRQKVISLDDISIKKLKSSSGKNYLKQVPNGENINIILSK